MNWFAWLIVICFVIWLQTVRPVLGIRSYSHVPLTLDMVRERVLLVLRLYDKINPEKASISPVLHLPVSEVSVFLFIFLLFPQLIYQVWSNKKYREGIRGISNWCKRKTHLLTDRGRYKYFLLGYWRNYLIKFSCKKFDIEWVGLVNCMRLDCTLKSVF